MLAHNEMYSCEISLAKFILDVLINVKFTLLSSDSVVLGDHTSTVGPSQSKQCSGPLAGENH